MNTLSVSGNASIIHCWFIVMLAMMLENQSPHFQMSQCFPMDPDIDAAIVTDDDTDTRCVHTLGLMGQNHCLLNLSELDIIAVKFNANR